MQINKDRDWEALYLANDTFWDHGEASPGLVDYLGANPRLSPGQALVPGCGRGHDARALAKAGWSVTGLDIAPSSVPLAKRLAEEGGLPVDYRVGDFLSNEAYQPFAQESWMPRLTEFGNLLVMRTVSKLGLAGIRLGYVAGAPEWLSQLDKVRPPYNVNVLTEATALFALEHVDVLDDQAAQLRAECSRLAAAMA